MFGRPIFLLLLGTLFLHGVTTYGQQPAPGKEKVVELVSRTDAAEPELPYEKELTLTFDPCKGEQPGNVLGVSEQTPLAERVAAFIKKLSDPTPKTRACAARQLGYIGPDAQAAVPHLIQRIYDEENERVWGHVEEVLWSIGPVRTPAELTDSKVRRSEWLKMAKAPDKLLRCYAVFALGYYRPISEENKIVQALIAATNDQDAAVRWMAFKGIGRLGPVAADAVPVLVKLLQTGDQSVKMQSTIALGQIGPAATAAVPELLNQLYSDDFALYHQSAVALAYMGPAIFPLLKHDLKAHPFAVLQVLRYMGPAAVPLLVEALQLPNSNVKKKAMEQLQLRAEQAEPAVPALINTLKDKDSRTREEAALTLQKIGPVAKAAVPALIARLSDADSMVRCSAADALGAIGPDAKAAVPTLIKMMNTSVRPGPGDYQRCAAKGLMQMSAETRALVPANLVKKVEEREAELKAMIAPSVFGPDPSRPKAKPEDKPLPRSY